MQKLREPRYILEHRGFFEDSDYLCIVSELMVTDMRDLFNKAARELTEEQAREFFRKMTESIQICHNSGIIHRDVKMENFLVDVADDSDLIIKLSDFGYACKDDEAAAQSDQAIDGKCGSLYGMAPETLKDNQYSMKVDIWALGVVLYELLTN